MTTADQLAIVTKTLSGHGDEKAIVLADGGLVEEWTSSRRLLVIVQSGHTYALFIFVAKAIPIYSTDDLHLDTVLPLDNTFRCEVDSGNAALYIKMASARTELLFEMLPGYHTQNFVSETFRIMDRITSSPASQLPATGSGFDWLQKYIAIAAEKKTDPSLADSKTMTSDSSRKGATSDSTRRGDQGDDPLALRDSSASGATMIAARESVVKHQMNMKEELFTDIQYFTVYTATWNVNGQAPSGLLTEWLVDTTRPPPDVYAIGFQELDLSKEAFVFNESPREEEWLRMVTASLHPDAKYHKVRLVRLVGMMLIVFVKESLVPFISKVAAETVGTGIMGMLGNKGGVAVRMELHNTAICFVNSHLAAHVSEVERRNQDYHDITNRVVFQQCSPPLTIKDHDMIFWIGDLNYRITDLDVDTVKDMIAQAKLDLLFPADQLTQQKFQRKIFSGFSEGQLTFPPTYKFDPGTDKWDSSEKARAPAWTDRVLWKGEHINQMTYRSHMELKISDHKPVSAVFTAGMKVVDPVKYRKIYEDVMKKLDKLENEFLPQVSVDSTEVTFESVSFIEPVTKSLIVANTGQVPVQFEFIKKLNDKSFCKPWLSVEPSMGFIMPGDKCDLSIELYVDKKTAGSLNAGTDQLYDILVLHLVGGKDIFITVSGTYRKSCFGSSIDALCRLHVPIAQLSAGAVLELEKEQEGAAGNTTLTDESHEAYPVPKELWFLCDLITTLGLQQEQLFLQPGLRSEILMIRDWLDTGHPVDKPPSVSIHSAAEALLLFLESLRLPIIPFSAYPHCLECSNNYLQCRQIVAQMLPPHHKFVFNYICTFLKEVMRYKEQNGADSKILATLFAAIMLRDPPSNTVQGPRLLARSQQQFLDQKKARFVYHFLVNDDLE